MSEHSGSAPDSDDEGWPAGRVAVHRFGARTVVLAVHLADYRETFVVVTGDKSVAVTMFDEADVTHREAQVFVFAKPYGWSLDLPDEEALLLVWETIGVQR